jgi:cardiolipin synthase
LDNAPSNEEQLKRIVTVPNAVTAVRLLLIPLYLYLLFGRHASAQAALLLAVLGITDFVDGYIARHFNQTTTLGKVLDPVADRVFMLTAVLSVAWVGAAPWWFAGATLAREVLVSAATLLLAALGAKRIDVLWVGKAGTFWLMVAYPSFLMGHGTASWQAYFRGLGWVAGLAGLVMAWVALVSYVKPARQALAAGKTGTD